MITERRNIIAERAYTLNQNRYKMLKLLTSKITHHLLLHSVFAAKPVPASAPLLHAVLRYKHQNVDYSRYPKLNEEELEESFTRGSGPGGQSVNKTSNCVLLRHIPTNILVKCHIHRSAHKNRAEARKILLEKLDLLINGDYAIQNQLKLIEGKKSAERKRRQNKLLDMKQKWKEREKQEVGDDAQGDVK